VQFGNFAQAQEALDGSVRFLLMIDRHEADILFVFQPQVEFFGVILRTEPKIFKTASSSANATATPVVRRIESSRFRGEEADEYEGERFWDSRRNKPAVLETIEGSVTSGDSPTPTYVAPVTPHAARIPTTPETTPLRRAMASMNLADANQLSTPYHPSGGFGYWPGIQPMTTPGGALSWGVHLTTPRASGSEHFSFSSDGDEGGARL